MQPDIAKYHYCQGRVYVLAIVKDVHTSLLLSKEIVIFSITSCIFSRCEMKWKKDVKFIMYYLPFVQVILQLPNRDYITYIL